MIIQGASIIEHMVDYVIQHNSSIIEGLIAAIMVAALYISYRSLKLKPEEQGPGLSNLGDLEETLKKLLDKAAAMPMAGSSGTNGAPSPELLGQIDNLKKDLTDRQGEIESLKAAVASAGTNTNLSSEEKAKLEAQIKELANKLAEYEIISEDIADLSFYKEENAKLVRQLESLKSGTPPPPPAQTVPSPASPAPAAPKAEPEIVGKAKVKAESEPAVVDDNLMAEFAKAIEEQKGPGIPKAVVTPPAVPEPEESSLGSMDMDKMLAEASGLESSAGLDASINALESGLDENKLLQEADALQDPPIKADDKHLMNEFENFVKKGSS